MIQMVFVIDLNVCVGCYVCVMSCKEWNMFGEVGSFVDLCLYDDDLFGMFFNCVQIYEVGVFLMMDMIYFLKLCLYCEDLLCVFVCLIGVSFKCKLDGIVLVDYDKCIGCKYCVWVCLYGVCEFDEGCKEMMKCMLCVDCIDNEVLFECDCKLVCVFVCLMLVWLFGDVYDLELDVLCVICDCGGYVLMFEWGMWLLNYYLLCVKIEVLCGCGSSGGCGSVLNGCDDDLFEVCVVCGDIDFVLLVILC